MFTPKPLQNTKQPRKKKKLNAALWTVCSTVGALSVIGSVALMVGWRQQLPANQISEVQQAKAQVAQIREVYLEKLSRTDYNMDHLSSYSSVEGTPTLTGWRQLAAALWGQQLKAEVSKMQSDEKSGFYRLHYMPALEIVKFNSLDKLLEAASGNNSFYWGYKRTDGTKVEEKLPPGAAAVLLLGKLEAIDYAQNLESQPAVDLNQMLIQIKNAQEPYSLAQAQLLRARGYTDPVEQMAQVADIRERIKQREEARRVYIQLLKKRPSQSVNQKQPVSKQSGE
ncbi:phage terminase large subunit family protein [Iningainema tapete]|uniref:Phage terminase large subunit family protein n=1 Tax=Iningainema tapete BLCC-T55 TaxID=2748662 RepID=A0A8J6XJT9_9CYAN|nr:phage terminase large subunit family protein [Iningainema tapete BLCC-T55]